MTATLGQPGATSGQTGDTPAPTALPTVGPTQPARARGFVFPDLAAGSNGEFGQVAFGPDGVLHLAYTGKTELDGTYPVRYGRCAGDCASAASWEFVTVADHGLWGGFVRLALDGSGRPRLLWQSAAALEAPSDLVYAECDAGCTSQAGWRGLNLGPLPGNGSVSGRSAARSLGVDARGAVHFVGSVSGQLLYATCAQDCANPAAGWRTGWLEGAAGPYAAATVAGDGTVHVAYAAEAPGAGSGAHVLTYRLCASECVDSMSWSAPAGLFYMSATTVDIALDRSGRPRIAFNQGQPGVPSAVSADRLAFYAWCDTGCTTATGWQSTSVGLPAGAGESSVSLAIDAQDAPIISANFSPSPYALGLTRCSGACNTVAATWATHALETADELEARSPAPLPACLVSGGTPRPAKAFWYPGEESLIALHPSAPQFAIVHSAYTLEQCGSTLEGEGVRIVRYAGGALP